MPGDAEYREQANALAAHLDGIAGALTSLVRLTDSLAVHPGADEALAQVYERWGRVQRAAGSVVLPTEVESTGIQAESPGLAPAATATAEIEVLSKSGRLLGPHTLIIGDTFAPLHGAQGRALRILMDTKATGPIAAPDLLRRLQREGGGVIPHLREHTNELVETMNALFSPDAIIVTPVHNTVSYLLDSSIDIAIDDSEALRERLSGQNMYDSIVDVSELGYPTDPRQDSIIIEIVGDTSYTH